MLLDGTPPAVSLGGLTLLGAGSAVLLDAGTTFVLASWSPSPSRSPTGEGCGRVDPTVLAR